MEITIADALGDRFHMWYHPAWPARDLKPVWTLPECVRYANGQLRSNTRNISNWTNANEAARLMWVNWIFQRLDQEPIRKPILTHWTPDHLSVDCGDTRLMCLNLRPDPGLVKVLCTAPIEVSDQFQGWTRIASNQEMLAAIDFNPQALVVLRAGQTQAIEWMEIGDPSTAHHLHDEPHRVAMLQRYIYSQPQNFFFSVDWARTPVDWSIYST